MDRPRGQTHSRRLARGRAGRDLGCESAAARGAAECFGTLGLPTGHGAGRADGEKQALAADADRLLRARETGSQPPFTFTRSRPGRVDSALEVRPPWPAALAAGDRRVRGRQLAGCLRKTRGAPAGFAALWGTL